MIPLRLKITGFLSYRDPVEVDFRSFKLACISGHNGAGKSSLLDAITWVLFGQARKRDETLINSASETAEVVFTFRYEENTYRIQRILTKGKSAVLEFQIQDAERWRPLTEATSRATQARIESVLRLDYGTFVNASFFLQGKADQFTQQRPTERKTILASILGLEQWETYRERTVEQRKNLERNVDRIDGRLTEINSELSEEASRRAHLKELEQELVRLQETRKTQETLKASIDQALSALKRQKELVEKLFLQIGSGEAELKNMAARQAEREAERLQHVRVTDRAVDVEKAYQDWQSTRAALEKWNALAEQFREQEKVRQEPMAKIGAEQARLQQELASLINQEKQVLAKQEQFVQLEAELVQVNLSLAELETRLKVRARLEQAQSIISRFREQARLRQTPLTEINLEKARLEQERKTLDKQREAVETQQSALGKLQSDLSEAQEQVQRFETQLASRKTLEQEIQTKKERQFIVKTGNDRLKLEMETLDERIKKLTGSAGAVCPLCGQPLSATERQNLINSLSAEGKEKGDEFRKNKAELDVILKEISTFEKEFSGFGRADKDHLFHIEMVTKIKERVSANLQAIAEWTQQGAPRLIEIENFLTNENFSPSARQHLARVDRELEAIGKALDVKPSGEQSIFETVEEKVLEIENELKSLKTFEEERNAKNALAIKLTENTRALRSSAAEWQAQGKPRLAEIQATLDAGDFSIPERVKLAEIDSHLLSLGYDAGAHDAIRQAEQAGRASENQVRELHAARAALIPLERELQELNQQIQTKSTDLGVLKNDHQLAHNTLVELQANTPDADEAERALLDARQRENIVTREAGVAQQKVNVLGTLRERKLSYEMEREELARTIKNHKTLERAFGKDGVPAMLIEQALPQIEEKANELLDRLSNGTMNVRFVTQAEFKNKKREDLKETLDIQISDEAGTRDYEMFSGGEAFRVNFAIRLALSEVLARRTGARLQTLVIDEGFGSQDAEGRQRLIEAINQVKGDFEKILIITHLEELKEAFPNRIEVEKTLRGSTVKVI